MSLPLTPVREPPRLLDVVALSNRLGCSARHIYRLAAAGALPPPVKLGALNRWSSDAIDAWIVSGCKRTGQSGGVS